MRKRCLLAIWLDAFRTDYLEKPTAPFIYQLSKEGLQGESETLLAFDGIGASILTGVSPLKHGVWTQFCFNPASSPFRWTKEASRLNRFVDALADKAGAVGQVGRAALNLLVLRLSRRIEGRASLHVPPMIPLQNLQFFDTTFHVSMYKSHVLAVPTIFDMLREQGILFKVFDGLRDADAFKSAARVDKKAKLVFVHFVNIDTVGHTVGPYTERIWKWLREVDRRVMRIVEEHQKTFDTDIFIFSDHGMLEVDKTVNILGQLWRSGLKEGKDFIVFIDSTMARFWIQNQKCERRIVEVLDRIQGGKILSQEDLKRYQIPNDRKYGDVIWLADAGTLMLPNYYQGMKPVKGMHGYAPGLKELRSPIIIHGEDLPSGRIQRTATPKDILPTVLDLMNMNTRAHVEGKSLLKYR